MSKVQSIKVEDIVLDSNIYPRINIDHKRVSMFEENMRDGFEFDPIHLQEHPDEPGKYRILDGAHRFKACKGIGEKEVKAEIINLNGEDPLLYAASKAIGPRELKDEEARQTARKAYRNNPRISSSKVGKAIGRSRQAVDSYISDLRAAIQLKHDLILFKMNRLGIPQKKISERLGVHLKTIYNHISAKMPTMAKLPISDLKKGFTISQVAEKHDWPVSLVWSVALDGKNDHCRFRELQWEIRTWDYWAWNDCDKRFGDEWPGRIPAQLIAHILYFFSKENDLVIDPMAGGGVVADTCLAFNRRCWSFDMIDRPDARPEIAPYFWDFDDLKWPVNPKTKPDLIIFDPPYFSKKNSEYEEASISNLTRDKYLRFLEDFFKLASENSKKGTRVVMINADWRDFQSTPALEETSEQSILIDEYITRIKNAGWDVTHIIQAPMSSERFQANVVAAMQKKKILGVTSRYVIVAKKQAEAF
ncbi:MAG: ParB N-terminal domain-containing protein [Deltaproteobacteria bacterium]|nr:ParB N-terminal domain-containing protein [Deltaproteobacteria bacterium]